MGKVETLAKYKDLFQCLLFVAQRARSNAEEMDATMPATGLKIHPALKHLDSHLYNDEDALNLVKVFNLYISKFEDGTINQSDIFNGLTLARHSDIVSACYEIFASINDYAVKAIPTPLAVIRELSAAGID